MNNHKNKKLRTIAEDWPSTITLTLVGIVAMHALGAKYEGWPWMLKGCITQIGESSVDTGAAGAVYLGLSAVAAISAGFAGVIIVFGLTSESEIFRRFRKSSDKRLSATWTSVIASAFLASALSIGAALTQLVGRPFVANMLFELGCALLIHSAIRSLWILRLLLQLVLVDDRKKISAEQTKRYGNPFLGMSA